MKVTKYTTKSGHVYEVAEIDGASRIISSTSPMAKFIIFQDCSHQNGRLYINSTDPSNQVITSSIVKIEEDDDL